MITAVKNGVIFANFLKNTTNGILRPETLYWGTRSRQEVKKVCLTFENIIIIFFFYFKISYKCEISVEVKLSRNKLKKTK